MYLIQIGKLILGLTSFSKQLEKPKKIFILKHLTARIPRASQVHPKGHFPDFNTRREKPS